MAKQTQQQEHEIHENQTSKERYQLRLGWLILPVLLLAMYAFLKSIAPVLSWDQVMDWLGVSGDRERFTMMTILMLVLILITAIWRILRS